MKDVNNDKRDAMCGGSGRVVRFLRSVGSTNSYVGERADEMADGEAVAVYEQMAGRGQRGNVWESDAGENVTMSVLLRPQGLDIARAFPLSESVAVAVARVVEDEIRATCGEALRVGVKWPNDVYVGDRKIAGILIENSLSGRMVGRSIVGIGLNVNQRRFVSDAPNPVSLWQLTGVERAVPEMVCRVMSALDESLEQMRTDASGLHEEYMRRLWRGRGVHEFEVAATGERFRGEVVGVAESGYITLARADDGRRVEFAFKEIVWVK